MKSFIGIDIGGTKISGIRIQGDDIQKRAQKETGADRPVKKIMATLYEVIDELLNKEVVGIGIGVPGILDVKKGEIISINNIREFNGYNIKIPVEEKYGMPAFINNDANCFTLSEAYFGAGKEFNNIIGITLGTGVGGGIVIDRKVYSGNLGAAGEFGCVPYEDALYEDYGGSKFFEKNFGLTAKQLFEMAEAGDSLALDIFRKYGVHIAALITKLMLFMAPEAIIIGGSISNAFKYFEAPIQEMLDEFFIPIIAKNLVVLKAELSDSGILGAAALAMSEME